MTDEAVEVQDSGLATGEQTVTQKDLDALRSTLDKQVAAAKAEADAYKARLQELTLQSIPDEKDREAEKARMEAEETRQRLQTLEMERQKAQALKEISSEFDVPVESIQAASDLAEAYRLAALYVKQNSRQPASPGAPVVGAPRGKKEESLTDRIAKAKAEGDLPALAALLREAQAAE